jgi:hypothetical protein
MLRTHSDEARAMFPSAVAVHVGTASAICNRVRHAHRRRVRSALFRAVAHAPLFWSLDAAVALLALGMAIAWSFPLAWLFDRAGGSIWPGALLHAVMQGGVKVLADDAAAFQNLALAWVALDLAAPWLFFLLRPVSERAAASNLRRR